MRSIRLSPEAIAAQLKLKKVPSPFGHPSYGLGKIKYIFFGI